MERGARYYKRARMGLLGLLACCLVALPGSAWALTPCAISAPDICAAPDSSDCDGDGFTNIEECNGLASAATGHYITIDGFNDGVPRAHRLDPADWDVFIITVPASVSALPPEPYGHVSDPPGAETDTGGLGITVHPLSTADVGTVGGQPDRRITDLQNALLVYENSWSPYSDAANCTFQPGWTEADLIFGEAYYGTANDPGNVYVWPRSIVDFITCKYSTAGNAMPVTLQEDYIREVVAHEVGHHLKLTKDYNPRFGGHHEKTGSGVIMEQSVKYTVKGSTVTFYVTSDFSDPSRTDALFR